MHSLHTSKDLDALLADMDNRSVIMLGEASHGTHEYYSWRTAISKRLIEQRVIISLPLRVTGRTVTCSIAL